MSIKKTTMGKHCGLWGVETCKGLFSIGMFRFYELGKVLNLGPRRGQYLRDTVCGRPTWLAFFGPALAFVKGRRIQTAALCKTGTRHTVFICKAFYCSPHIFMCHISLPLVMLPNTADRFSN